MNGDGDRPQPHRSSQVGGGLQHERTGLAWERTAISMMVSGLILARYGGGNGWVGIELVGLAQTVAGGLLLAWAGKNDRLLHDLSRPPDVVAQVGLTRLVGLGTVVFSAVALTFGLLVAIG